MAIPRRLLPVTAFLSLFLVFLLYRRSDTVKSQWRQSSETVAQKVGMGDFAWGESQRQDWDPSDALTPMAANANWKEKLVPGTPKPHGENYTRVLVIPRTTKEDISWMDKEIPDVEKVVYVADDPTAPLHPPANKGHEAIVYLTYIIDNYDKLPDIMLFMHAHQRTWHNNDVLNSDAAEMIRQLSSERVIREGYMNMRCQWYPGCPDWMHPGNMEFDVYKTEQVLIAKAWVEIFPFDPVPDVLAQPCCSQFALSRERVLSIPKAQFEFYRNWIMTTKLKDFISGRVWEYMWQYAFTGKNYWCPVEHVCYCDGYGYCFGGKEKLDDWVRLRERRDEFNSKLLEWQEKERNIKEAIEEGRKDEASKMPQPEEGKDHEWWGEIEKYQKLMDEQANAAKERGKDPRNRALEAGRPWKEGDGF